MIWEWNSNLEYQDSKDNCLDSLIRENLATVPISEIKDLKNKVNFYLAHFMIMARKRDGESSERRVSYLKKMNSILENEIQYRQRKIFI